MKVNTNTKKKMEISSSGYKTPCFPPIESKSYGSVLSELTNVIERMHTSNDIEGILRISAEAMNDLLNSETSSFIIADEHGYLLVNGSDSQIGISRKLTIGAGVAGRVAEDRNTLIINDIATDKRFNRDYDSLSGKRIRSVLAIPIFDKNIFIGIGESLNKKDQKGFDEFDAKLFNFLCKQTTIAISNIRKLNSERKRKLKIGKLYDVLMLEKAKRDTILQSITSGVMVVSLSGKLDFMNGRARSLLGMPAMVDNLATNMPAWVDKLWIQINQVAENQENRELNLETSDRILKINIIPIRYFEKTDSIAIVVDDITELFKLNEVKANFISHLSHEFKTPLSSAIGAVKLIRKFRPNTNNLPHQEEKLLSMIEQDCMLMSDLMNDTLDLAKLEAGLLECAVEKVCVSDICDKVMETLAPKAIEGNVYFENRIPDKLSDVLAESRMVCNLISNLLSNAVKYAPPRSVVRVDAFENGDGTIKFMITDNGTGIPRDERERIFRKFYQGAKSIYSKDKSTGLGLSICKSIVRAFGGDIWVEDPEIASKTLNEDKSGATFAFTLLSASENH